MDNGLSKQEHDLVGALMADYVIRTRKEFNNDNFTCHYREPSKPGTVTFYGRVLKDTYFPCINDIIKANEMVFVTFLTDPGNDYMLLTHVELAELG